MSASERKIVKAWDQAMHALCAQIEAVLSDAIPADEQKRQLRDLVNQVLTYNRGVDLFPKRQAIAWLAEKYAVSERTVHHWKKAGCPFELGQWKVLDWLAVRRVLPERTKLRFHRQIQLRYERAKRRRLYGLVQTARILGRMLP